MSKLFQAIGLAVVVYFLSTLFLESSSQKFLLSLVTLLLVLWTNEGLPMGVVSLLPVLLFPVFNILDISEIAPNYSRSIIFLFIGGFLIAIGMEKINLHKVLAYKFMRLFPKTPLGLIYALFITSALLSAFLSNTTVALMLIPIALLLSKEKKIKTRLLLSIAYGASVGGILTPIGTPPNLILLGFIEKTVLPAITFSEWLFKMLPLTMVMILIVPYLLSINLPKKKMFSPTKKEKITLQHKKMLGLLAMLVIFLFLQEALKTSFPFLHWLNDKVILLNFGLILFSPGINILSWKEDFKKVPFEIVFLFGAGFTIATSVSATGLATVFIPKLEFLLTLSSLWLFVFLVGFVSFATSIMSNTALIAIVLPIFYAFCNQVGLNSQLVLITLTVASSYAFMLPISTPPNAIVMGSGFVRMKHMITQGFFVNVVGIIVLSFFAVFVWS